jgi:FPC/CPF motif-containing protein YcgG
MAATYSIPTEGFLLQPDGEPSSALAARVHAAFRALVLDPEFPCVGARSALNQESYRFALYDELNTDGSTNDLAADLRSFVDEFDRLPGEFSTFIACFDAPKSLDQEVFEELLWQQLHRLHALDDDPWDQAVSSDPADPKFSFSFAGRAFFVVGLQPNGPRWARTFPWPTLVFNAHDQFERLREQGQFERIQEVIRDRDTQLEGDVNPNLANFGEHTEARQYSGRPVEGEWKCPVQFEK